jgi:hypothetical protein
MSKRKARKARKEYLDSVWKGIEIQEKLAARLIEWSKTDNYVRIVKESKQ